MAENFFKKALEVDLVDNPYDSTDGLHAAAMGGIYNLALYRDLQGYPLMIVHYT